MKTVWRVFVYLKRYPLLAIATLACAIAGTLMVVVPPAATKYVLNNVINGQHPERLLPLLAWSHPRFARIEIDLPRANSGMAEA